MAEDVRDETELEHEWNHLLVEWEKMGPLYEPIKASARIKVVEIESMGYWGQKGQLFPIVAPLEGETNNIKLSN